MDYSVSCRVLIILLVVLMFRDLLFDCHLSALVSLRTIVSAHVYTDSLWYYTGKATYETSAIINNALWKVIMSSMWTNWGSIYKKIGKKSGLHISLRELKMYSEWYLCICHGFISKWGKMNGLVCVKLGFMTLIAELMSI